MSNNLRDQIYRNLNTRESDELLEIWQENNRAEGSDTAFDAIREILTERLGNVPSQNEPIYEYIEDGIEVEDEAYGFSEEELTIIDDENPPEFYDPFEVLIISKWLNWGAKAMVVLAILYNLVQILPTMKEIVESYFRANPNPTLVFIITFVLVSLNTIISVAISYFLLITLSRVLKILMQMEFNSRPKQSE